MEQALLNGELSLSYPEGFVQTDTLELSRSGFVDRAPYFSIKDAERHLSVTASWREAGRLAAALTGVTAEARKRAAIFARAMTGRAFRAEPPAACSVGGGKAASCRCFYSQEGVEIGCASLVARRGRRFYYIHCYYQTAHAAEALPVWEAIRDSMAWN